MTRTRITPSAGLRRYGYSAGIRIRGYVSDPHTRPHSLIHSTHPLLRHTDSTPPDT